RNIDTGTSWSAPMKTCDVSLWDRSSRWMTGLMAISWPSGRTQYSLRPAGARHGGLHRQHLAGSRCGRHAPRATPLVGDQEQRPAIISAQDAGEAAAVEVNRVEHDAALTDS